MPKRRHLRIPIAGGPGKNLPQAQAYISVNVVFATLFWPIPGSLANARPGSFADVFFFSIETLATSVMARCIRRLYGHAVVATEIVCGLAFTAILTGLTSVRFYGELALGSRRGDCAAVSSRSEPASNDVSRQPLSWALFENKTLFEEW